MNQFKSDNLKCISKFLDNFRDNTECLFLNFSYDTSIIINKEYMCINSLKKGLFLKIDIDLFKEILQDVKEFNKFVLTLDGVETEFIFKDLEIIGLKDGVNYDK